MKIKYETNIATFVQFIVMSLLAIANGLKSIIVDCVKNPSDCVGDVFTNFILFMLTVFFFANVWILGYVAHDRRSPRLAALLIALEAGIITVALFNARHYTDYLGLATSIIDTVLAIWVILSCVLLIQHRGKRTVVRRAGRRRRR